MEKCAKLGGIYLWVHISGHPEEVEGVIGCRCGIGTQGVFMRVGVAARVVAGCPITLLCSSCLSSGRWEIRIQRTALESGTSFYVTQVFDLTLDLVVGGLHYGWRCLHEETKGKVICGVSYESGESVIRKAIGTVKGKRGRRWCCVVDHG